jgi:hypothetical protein
MLLGWQATQAEATAAHFGGGFDGGNPVAQLGQRYRQPPRARAEVNDPGWWGHQPVNNAEGLVSEALVNVSIRQFVNAVVILGPGIMGVRRFVLVVVHGVIFCLLRLSLAWTV